MDNNRLFEVTKIINNLKHNDYEVADYKMCKDEADTTLFYLEWVKSVLEKTEN